MGHAQLIEQIAKTFCEASGFYKWDDTKGSLRDWYLKGAEAVSQLPDQAAGVEVVCSPLGLSDKL
jgi:hypothetical protein